MSALGASARIVRETIAAFGATWSRFWFEPRSTMPLEIVRIGVGAAVLFHYGMATPFLFDLWGDTGWVSRDVALEQLSSPWMQSVLFYFTAPWQWIAFHTLFLACCAGLVLGWRTSWVKWIVLIGHISYDYRNLTISYGAESIAACLLVILCLAPIGRAMSLDRVRAVRAAKRKNLNASVPPYVSPWAGACTRLVQIQMAVLFFYSGIEKIRGDEWWSGDAIWLAFTTNEFYNGPLVWLLARQYWLVTVGTYATILIEIAYAFLIWRRRTRPYLLAAAIFLHLGFGFGLGLVYFSFVMIMGHMSFLRQEWLTRLGAWWKGKAGPFEMVYESDHASSVGSLARLLAFDGLNQIRARDSRSDLAAQAGDAEPVKAFYLQLPDGQALTGIETYRYVAWRVPGLWWLAPILYVPVLNRLFGYRSLDRMTVNPLRWGKDRVAYLAMSLFIGWHAMAIVVGPLPNESMPVDTVRALSGPHHDVSAGEFVVIL